jgi:hypothetical protein
VSTWGLIETIRRLRDAKPFVPFRIRLKDGNVGTVITLEQVWLPPGNKYVVLWSQVSSFFTYSFEERLIETVEVQHWVDARE